jgi:hypothetical protein
LEGLDSGIPWVMFGFVDFALTFAFDFCLSASAISINSAIPSTLSLSSLSGSMPRANLISLRPTGQPGYPTTFPNMLTRTSLLFRMSSNLSFLLRFWHYFFFLKYYGSVPFCTYSGIMISFRYYSISALNLSLSALSWFHSGE